MRTIAARTILLTSGLALALGMSTDARAAATANFQGVCVWNTVHTQYVCNFDATRPTSSPSSCSGSFIWKYQWDFDDGSALLTGNPLAPHTFLDGPERVVTLTVICWNGEIAIRSRHVCNRVGTPGCIKIDGRWY